MVKMSRGGLLVEKELLAIRMRQGVLVILEGWSSRLPLLNI